MFGFFVVHECSRWLALRDNDHDVSGGRFHETAGKSNANRQPSQAS